MTSGEGIFADANILVYAAIRDDVRHAACRNLLKNPGDTLLHFSPQILTEFYSVITNPKRVTAPFTPTEAIEFIEILLSYRHSAPLPITAEVPAILLSLLKQRVVRGPRVFDLQIGATMLAHGVSRLATYNGADFKDIAGIEIVEPERVPEAM